MVPALILLAVKRVCQIFSRGGDAWAVALLKHCPVPDWLISGGESGGGARPVNPQWVRDIIADCRRRGVVPFHKQWGTYSSNPLVVEQGMSIAEAKGVGQIRT